MSDLNARVTEVSKSPARLSVREKDLIVSRNRDLARQTGSYAYSFANDGDGLVEIRVHGPGRRAKVTVTPVDPRGIPVGRERWHFSLRARIAGWVGAVAAVNALVELVF